MSAGQSQSQYTATVVATIERCVSITPFERPVVPPV